MLDEPTPDGMAGSLVLQVWDDGKLRQTSFLVAEGQSFTDVCDILNRPGLRILKKQAEREVVVARGTLALAPVVVADDNTIRVAAGEERGEISSATGHLGAFLINLGDTIGRPVVDETKSGGHPVKFVFDESVIKAADNPAELRKVFASVSQQTGLRLETQRRPTTVYFVDEGEAAGK